MKGVRTRIAPSPTGTLHIGTARTALFNFLFARQRKGAFVTRIEDTDLERSEKRFEEDILAGLDWLGIKADESPVAGGPYGAYRQTERIATYSEAQQKLLANGQAYYCFHSAEELEAERKAAQEGKGSPTHRCSFREEDPGKLAVRAEAGERGVIRFKTTPKRVIEFRDLIRGTIAFESDLVGDFSIAKNLTTPLYNFAVVIDDATMEISHVIRGEDHIANTPKQLLLGQALGLPMPEYAHLPLILGTDRSKLSKRHGATSIEEFKRQGYLSEAIVNFMALLGWNSGTERELFTMDELIEVFDLARVQPSGAIWNQEKLDWMNGEYIRGKSPERLAKDAAAFLPHGHENYPKEYVSRVITVEQPRLKKLSDLENAGFFFNEDPVGDTALLRWKAMTDAQVGESLAAAERLISDIAESEFSADMLEKKFLAEIGSGDKGTTLWPLRVALSGKKASPGPFEIMEILGKDRTLARIRSARAKISG